MPTGLVANLACTRGTYFVNAQRRTTVLAPVQQAVNPLPDLLLVTSIRPHPRTRFRQRLDSCIHFAPGHSSGWSGMETTQGVEHLDK
jgi:hypothetical protein